MRNRGASFMVSKTNTVLSSAAEARYLPSGEKVRAVMLPRWRSENVAMRSYENAVPTDDGGMMESETAGGDLISLFRLGDQSLACFELKLENRGDC